MSNARHDILITAVEKQLRGSLTTMIQSFFCQENNAKVNEDYSITLTSSETQLLFSSMNISGKKKNQTKTTHQQSKEDQEERGKKR